MVSRNQDVISQNNRSQDIPIFYSEFLQIYLFFLRRARDVGEFDFCFPKHQAQEQSFSRSREFISLCNNTYM